MSRAQTPDLSALWGRRREERRLLLASLGCLTLGFLLILGSGHAAGHQLAPADLLPLLIYGISLAGLHLGLVALGHRGDQVLVAVVAFLAGLGLLAQTRMGTIDQSGLVPGPLLFPLGLTVLLATAAAFMDGRYRLLAQGYWVWGGLSVALVALLLVTGERFRGAVFGLGFTTPTEALKVLAVLFLAGFMDQHGRALGRWHPHLPLPPLEPLWQLAAFWAALTGLLLIQRDLGMVAILGVALLALLVTGTGRIGYLVYGLLGTIALGALALGVFAHGERRIAAWLDPFQDPTGDGWQVLQGLSGMYAGGLWGEGFGRGSPGYTPIAESDFIYAVIGEELGFAGCTLVVLLFLVLFARGLQIAQGGRCAFGRLLATGLTAVLATQTVLNLGGVTKLIPLTGTTLPLISHGGTSLLATFATLGLLLAVSHGAPGPGAPRSRGAQGRDVAASTPSPGQARRKAVRRPVAKDGVRPPHPREAGPTPGKRHSTQWDRETDGVDGGRAPVPGRRDARR